MAHPTHWQPETPGLRDKTPQRTHCPTPFLTGALGRIRTNDNPSNREEVLKILNSSFAKMSATAPQSLNPRCTLLSPAKRFDDQDSVVLLRSSTRNGRPAGRCKTTASGIGSSFLSSSVWKRRILRWHRRGRGCLKIQGSERYRRGSRRVPTYGGCDNDVRVRHSRSSGLSGLFGSAGNPTGGGLQSPHVVPLDLANAMCAILSHV